MAFGRQLGLTATALSDHVRSLESCSGTRTPNNKGLNNVTAPPHAGSADASGADAEEGDMGEDNEPEEAFRYEHRYRRWATGRMAKK